MALITFIDDDPGWSELREYRREIDNLDIIRGIRLFGDLTLNSEYVTVNPVPVRIYQIGIKEVDDELGAIPL